MRSIGLICVVAACALWASTAHAALQVVGLRLSGTTWEQWIEPESTIDPTNGYRAACIVRSPTISYAMSWPDRTGDQPPDVGVTSFAFASGRLAAGFGGRLPFSSTSQTITLASVATAPTNSRTYALTSGFLGRADGFWTVGKNSLLPFLDLAALRRAKPLTFISRSKPAGACAAAGLPIIRAGS